MFSVLTCTSLCSMAGEEKNQNSNNIRQFLPMAAVVRQPLRRKRDEHGTAPQLLLPRPANLHPTTQACAHSGGTQSQTVPPDRQCAQAPHSFTCQGRSKRTPKMREVGCGRGGGGSKGLRVGTVVLLFVCMVVNDVAATALEATLIAVDNSGYMINSDHRYVGINQYIHANI